MNKKNFLNIHVIISYSPSCLNRDDMNMQKSAILGGVRRVRYSSQCLKYWMRNSNYFKEYLPGISTRTRAMAEEIEKTLKEQSQITQITNQDLHELVIEAIEIMVSKPNKKWLEKGRIFTQIIPWTDKEKESVIKVLTKVINDKVIKKDRRKVLEVALQANMANIADIFSKGKDIGLFGRMSTSSFMRKIDGAVSLAHSITTHAVDADIDWFTAVDGLVEEDISEDPDQGAAHMNTQEFSAGVFYRYAGVNLDQLAKNMGGGAGRPEALAVASHLVHLLATIVPSAKQNSFAAFNPADLVMTSFTDLPLSAVNAFEQPVEKDHKGGFLKPSIQAFEDYMGRVYKGFGLKDHKAVFSLWDIKLLPKEETPLTTKSFLTPQQETLDKLKDWVRNDGKIGQ